MDIKKYTKPKLPTTQNILEDIGKIDDMAHSPTRLSSNNDILNNAYVCFHNFGTLRSELLKRSELKIKLEDLNQELVNNIQCLKT